ncbi:Uu.00g036300.m01.CDS01 [Anthostomella pinea]|uniref:Uu.00g036300.m01.CDS01 n=1 Tax=Anthostomella pinea TaxID=933095 RepID=A0AAI8YDJ3_9PEZI|nr:Uu.00g036300.m01.CDS01 [Anthostomella pinea]
MFAAVVFTLAAASMASAHFALDYPTWRADTLENTSYSQWEYPCGGVPYGVGNRTDWAIGGGSLSLDLHHPWSYLYVNLGLGENVTNFNVSLTPSLTNVTGNGTFCIPQLLIPVSISDGQSATIQVVTSGASGAAMYNCADITFRYDAQLLSGDDCTNSTGVSAAIVDQSPTTSQSASTPTPTGSAAGAVNTGGVALLGALSFAGASMMGLVL